MPACVGAIVATANILETPGGDFRRLDKLTCVRLASVRGSGVGADRVFDEERPLADCVPLITEALEKS